MFGTRGAFEPTAHIYALWNACHLCPDGWRSPPPPLPAPPASPTTQSRPPLPRASLTCCLLTVSATTTTSLPASKAHAACTLFIYFDIFVQCFCHYTKLFEFTKLCNLTCVQSQTLHALWIKNRHALFLLMPNCWCFWHYNDKLIELTKSGV